MKENPILTNKDVFPGNKILRAVLKEKFALYEKLENLLTKAPYELTFEWRYYKDGKSWLCKIIDKKKTILWLSVWDGYFRVAFYFSAKVSEGIRYLAIDEQIKSDFSKTDFIGKVKPLVIDILDDSKMEDIMEIVLYKKKN